MGIWKVSKNTIRKSNPLLPLETGNKSMMDNKSRMSWEAHVRFCEKLGLKCPCLLDYSSPAKLRSVKTHKTSTSPFPPLTGIFYLQIISFQEVVGEVWFRCSGNINHGDFNCVLILLVKNTKQGGIAEKFFPYIWIGKSCNTFFEKNCAWPKTTDKLYLF